MVAKVEGERRWNRRILRNTKYAEGDEDFLTADFSDDTDTESLNRRSNREIYEIGEGGGGKTLEPQNTQN